MSSSLPEKILKKEFVILMALMTSVMALAIDSVLPALSFMNTELDINSIVKVQYIISVIFIGFGVGQLIYGPMSDAIGRKKPLYIGGLIFLIGCIISFYAESLTPMLIGRFLQGLGAASFRIISIAIVRDEYSGVAMARTLSLIMTVFILVPVLAPSIGQAILFLGPWRYIFLMLFTLSLIIMIWFYMRQDETLASSKRRVMSIKFFLSASLEAFTNPISASATFISGLIFGIMITYISTAQHIFQDIYNLGTQFPLYFGSLAFTIGLASFVNSFLLKRYGIIRLTKTSLTTMSISSIIFASYLTISHTTTPSLVLLMIFFAVFFFCLGLLFGNLNTLALSPLGHIAGIAASVIGSVQNFVSVLVGVFIASIFHNNFITLVICFAVVTSTSLAIFKFGDYKKIYQNV